MLAHVTKALLALVNVRHCFILLKVEMLIIDTLVGKSNLIYVIAVQLALGSLIKQHSLQFN